MPSTVSEPDFSNITRMVLAYFEAGDCTLDRLSKGREHLTARLPSWVLTKRRITIAYFPPGDFFAIRALPDPNLPVDEVTTAIVRTPEEWHAISAPITIVPQLARESGVWFGDPRVEEVGNPTAPPAWAPHVLFGMISNDSKLESFLSTDTAERGAIEHWSAAEFALDSHKGSVHEQLQLLFNRFSAIIRRKSFLEHRIHRFLKEHSRVMLPAHKQCYYEHRLQLGAKERIADFILEREFALPAILIELENPASPAFRQDGQLTQFANHAREQIREWVQIIDDGPGNRTGEMAFLAGPKIRLVVLGESLRFIDKMKESARSDTTIWTYDMLLQEAKERVHQELASLHKQMGRDASDVPKFR